MPLVTVDISSYDAFRTATLGNGYDVDGMYGYQCVDMAKLLAGNAGRPSPYWLSQPDGYAYEGWSNDASRAYNAADYFTLIYNKADVRRGDLVVLENTSSNPYGHIAFADDFRFQFGVERQSVLNLANNVLKIKIFLNCRGSGIMSSSRIAGKN